MTRLPAVPAATAAALLALGGCATLPDGGDVEPGVRTLESPAGHVFHLMAVPDADDVAMRVAWRSDRGTEPGRNPMVPMIGTRVLLAGGTATSSPAEVGQRFEDLGVQGGLGNDAEHVYGSLDYPAENADPTLELVGTLLAEPSIDDAWLARTKSDAVRDLREQDGLAATALWSVARRAVFGETALQAFLSTTDPAEVEAVGRDDVVAWHEAVFTAARPLVTIAGPLTDETAGRTVDAVLAPPSADAPPAPLAPATDFSTRTVLLHRPDETTSTLALIGSLPPTRQGGDHDDGVDLVALSAFGGGDRGPLFDAVRTRLRASYGFDVGSANYTADTRFLYITGEVETARLEETRALVAETWDAFRAAPDEERVDEIADAIAENFENPDDDVGYAASVMLAAANDGRDPAIVTGLADAIGAIDAERVRTRMADAFPTADELIVVAVSPDADALPGACVIARIEDVDGCR